MWCKAGIVKETETAVGMVQLVRRSLEAGTANIAGTASGMALLSEGSAWRADDGEV